MQGVASLWKGTLSSIGLRTIPIATQFALKESMQRVVLENTSLYLAEHTRIGSMYTHNKTKWVKVLALIS